MPLSSQDLVVKHVYQQQINSVPDLPEVIKQYFYEQITRYEQQEKLNVG